jgi:hypothetical protein
MSTDRAERPVWSLASRRGWRRNIRRMLAIVRPLGEPRSRVWIHQSGADSPDLEAALLGRAEVKAPVPSVNPEQRTQYEHEPA